MFHHFLVHAAFQSSRWFPRNQRLKLPKSSRYCDKPLLNNLIALIVFSFMATGGLAVTLTLTDPVPKSIRAAYHTFGVLSFTQGLCTIILTYNAPQCVSEYHARAVSLFTGTFMGLHSFFSILPDKRVSLADPPNVSELVQRHMPLVWCV
ncbi:hypothetical protein P4O66_009490, partial [Electrophorus voltai]